MRPLVLLRPEPGASASAARARMMGIETIVLPLFAVRPVPWAVPDAIESYDVLLVTSANAIRHAGDGLAVLVHLPVAAVGKATAETARSAGFSIAYEGDAGVDALLKSMPPGRRLLHLAGRDSVPSGVDAVIVYEAAPLSAPTGLAHVAGAVVAIHSPRSGARLVDLVDDAKIDRATVTIVAISEAAARAAGRGWQLVKVSSAPHDRALLACAAELCLNLAE